MVRRRVVTTLIAILTLSAAVGCTALTPHVALPDVLLGEPSFFPTLEAYAGSPIVAGNKVELLVNGDAIFPSLVADIRSAQRTVTYAQYYYEDGPVAREVAEALAERGRAGVGVNVLLDAFGSLAIPTEYVDLMRRSGCHVAWFRPLKQYVFRRYHKRNHRRIMVIDGRVGHTGGAGVSAKWMGDGRTPDHWRDTDVRVEGPVVEYMQAAFAENWLEATGVVLGGEAYFPRPIPPRGQTFAQIARSSPANGSAAMYTTFLLALSGARHSVLVTNPYFVLDDTMREALLNTVRRGVRVAVLVPGTIDHNLVRQASRAQFGALLKAGVEIYEYTPALLHAKTMVIDDVWATVGSTNLDNLSFAFNDEMNLIVYDRAFAQELTRVFAADIAASKRITFTAWKDRGFKARFLEVLALPIRDML
jgi:cardiolipin synthase A/B